MTDYSDEYGSPFGRINADYRQRLYFGGFCGSCV